MGEFLELGKKVLASQPFSVLIGAVLTKLEAGAAEIQIPIKDELKQQYGFAHGGVISYAADNAITFVAGSLLGESVVTAEFKINYLRSCVGRQLVARASVIHRGKLSVVCRCDVFVVDEEGVRLCASAQGTVSALDSSVEAQ
jgi:uncharacterized protein (TIGR00369 family)